MHCVTWQIITLLCCVCYDNKIKNIVFLSDYYKIITHVQKNIKCYNIQSTLLFNIQFMIGVYDDCFNNVVTSKSGGDIDNMAVLPWLPFHNRWMKLSYFSRSTTKWLLLMFIILVFLYFIKSKGYVTASLYIEHSSYLIVTVQHRWQ